MSGSLLHAVNHQKSAVYYSQNCDDILLKANTYSTYGYYLNLADRKEEALKAMQIGLSLFDQLNGDGIFYFDKYRAVINYADLLFSLGETDEAITQVSDAESALCELELQNTEIYADCVYSLGLYHLCLNDSAAEDEIMRAFRIFIKLYGNESDFVHTRLTELRNYMENANSDIMKYEPLKQLLGE